MLLFRAVPFRLVYEGEGDPNPNPNPDPNPNPNPNPQPKPGEAGTVVIDGVTYTKAQQEHLNSILAKDRRKHESKNQELITQLKAQQNAASTSEEDRQRLATRITELENEFKTKEQLEQQKSTQKIKEEKDRADANEAKAKDNWKLFEVTRITNDLITAATPPADSKKPRAYNPQQVVELLQSKTKLVPVLDADQKPIPGEYKTVIRLPSTDKDGKPVVLDLSPPEAIEQMAGRAEYANLFLSGASGGLGSGNLPHGGAGGGGGHERDNPPSDPAAYNEWRKKYGPLANRKGRR